MNFNLTLIAQAVTFALFIWFTVKFVWPPLLKAIEERQARIAVLSGPTFAVEVARGEPAAVGRPRHRPHCGVMMRRAPPQVLAIVEAPEAFPDRDYDGLTVSDDEWPPLLQPRKLLGFEGYHAWERHMVSRCADARLSPEQVVATLERDARYLRATVVADPAVVSFGVITALPLTSQVRFVNTTYPSNSRFGPKSLKSVSSTPKPW